MTERIDHTSWAQEFIRAAENAFDDEVTIDARETPTVAENIALAQVHATLALVEQQRIANIIAITTGSGYNMADDVAEQIAKDLGTWVEPGTTWGGGNGGR